MPACEWSELAGILSICRRLLGKMGPGDFWDQQWGKIWEKLVGVYLPPYTLGGIPFGEARGSFFCLAAFFVSLSYWVAVVENQQSRHSFHSRSSSHAFTDGPAFQRLAVSRLMLLLSRPVIRSTSLSV